MNFFPLIISILVLIVTTSAAISHSDKSKKQAINRSIAEFIAELLGQISFRVISTTITPIILKLAFMPIILILKLLSQPFVLNFISKPFIMIGLSGYLMVAFATIFLSKSGMANPMFEMRSQSDGIISSLNQLMSTNLSVIASQTMDFFDLDNDDCKLEMSCKAGKRMASAFPYVRYFLIQSGASNWIENEYIAHRPNHMSDGKQCPNICESLRGDNQNKYSSTVYSSDENPSDSVFEWLG